MPPPAGRGAVLRGATYLLALLVLATAHLPDAPLPEAGPSAMLHRVEEPDVPAEDEAPVIRLALAGVILAGVGLDLRRWRKPWR